MGSKSYGLNEWMLVMPYFLLFSFVNDTQSPVMNETHYGRQIMEVKEVRLIDFPQTRLRHVLERSLISSFQALLQD